MEDIQPLLQHGFKMSDVFFYAHLRGFRFRTGGHAAEQFRRGHGNTYIIQVFRTIQHVFEADVANASFSFGPGLDLLRNSSSSKSHAYVGGLR